MKSSVRLFREKMACCGCEACKEICPQKAIEMIQDEEGFFYPMIDEDNCITCGLCTAICPMKHNEDDSISEQLTLGVKNKRYDMRMRESSGGFFSVLCNYMLSRNGVIYGVKYSCDNKAAEYTRVEKDYEELFGSKYVQSIKGNIYTRIKKDLCEGRSVLFVGTPCDNAGLKRFLAINNCKTDNIIFCDMVCHGVPSPLIYSEYIAFLEDIFHSKVKNFSFRDKSINGWEGFGIRAEFCNGLKYYVPSMRDFYFVLFDYAHILRQSCYKCTWKKEQRYTDFTLGDFWGISKIDPSFCDSLGGVSLVLVNTEKARNIFNRLKADVEYKQYNIKQAVQYNDSLIRSRAECLEDRNRKLQELCDKGIEGTIRETWILWRMVAWIFEKVPRIKNVVDISVNQNWILLGIKEWMNKEVLGVYVNRSNDNCVVVKDYEQHNMEWNINLLRNRKIDLIRMQLEGLEYFYLQELRPRIIMDRPIVLVELMRKYSSNKNVPNDVIAYFREYGYECYAINDNLNIVPIDAITEETEEKWFLFTGEKVNFEL